MITVKDVSRARELIREKYINVREREWNIKTDVITEICKATNKRYINNRKNEFLLFGEKIEPSTITLTLFFCWKRKFVGIHCPTLSTINQFDKQTQEVYKIIDEYNAKVRKP